MLENFTLITGPCAAESFEQVYATAKGLKENLKDILPGGQFIFRAGAWKPRTRPGQFQGAGNISLDWLDGIHREFSLPIAVEVGMPEHLEQVLQHKIEYIWLGARTTCSPFLMESLAHNLKGTSLKVMIKNPINPELKLWAGAIERVLLAGIPEKDITLIHRGFSCYQESKYRYIPFWDIALKIREEFPLPLLCDPGHICGNTQDIPQTSRMALSLKYNGLMIESHYNPKLALSDAQQQLRPEELKNLLANLGLVEEHDQYYHSHLQ